MIQHDATDATAFRSPLGWQMMRATGVGWWGSALDQIVTRLAQASMAKLRSSSSHALPQSSLASFDAGVWGRAPEEQEQAVQAAAFKLLSRVVSVV